MDHIEELKKLKSLFDQGAITQEEFNSLKASLLSEIANTNNNDSPISPEQNSNISTDHLPQKPETKAEPRTEQEPEPKPKSKPEPKPAPLNKTKAGPKKDSKEYEEGGEFLQGLAYLLIAGSILLGLVFWIRYDSFILAAITLALTLGAPILISRATPKASRRGLFIASMIALYVFLIAFPIGASSLSEVDVDEPVEEVDDEGKRIREFLLDHTFANNEIGGTSYIAFKSDRGGWFGAMTLTMGYCDHVYSYNLEGRRIDLTYTGSTCSGFQGSSASMTFNHDNSISIIISGQTFRFHPL